MERRFNMATHDYHVRQYETMYETTRGLLELADECVGDMGDRLNADVACGAGANVAHMLRRWPNSKMVGYDLCKTDLDYAKGHVPSECEGRVEYKEADFFRLTEEVEAGTYACTTLMQTLLLFNPDTYPEVLRNVIHISSEWVFLTSLFADHNMDVTMQIRDHVRGDDVFYNIHDIPRFEANCKALGVKEVVIRDFNISIDLQAPPDGGVGTWTEKTEDGRRLQFSGAVPMPWKFCALRLK